MRPLMSIGQFATLTGLSVRALRLYEREGLLVPAVVDAQTGYRFYRWHQRAVAEQIRVLRALDVPLGGVARVVHAGADLDSVLAEHEAQLRRELAERERLLREVTQARRGPPLPTFTVRLRELRPWPLLTVTYRTSLAQCEADRREAARGLRARAARLGTRAAAPPFARHPAQGGFDPDDYRVTLHLPLRLAVPGSEPGPAGLVAFTRLRGPLSGVLHAHQAVGAWVAHSAFERTGVAAEVYLSGLRPHEDPHTEVWLPVRPRPDRP